MEKYLKSQHSINMNIDSGGSISVVFKKSITYYPVISAEFGIYNYYPTTKEDFEKEFNDTLEFIKNRINQ